MKIVRKLPSSFLLAPFLATSLSVPSAAQNLVRDAVHEEPFSLIGGVREMSDGKLMIADPLEKSLVLLDLDRGSVETVGREGGGPQEYRQPDAVYALRGDSTLLVDLGNSRFVIVRPDGSFGETKPLVAGQPGTQTFSVMLPEGVDRSGNVYYQARGAFRGGPTLPDSGTVVRMVWATGEVDTVGTIKLAERKSSTSGGSNNRNVSITPVPLSPQDDWAVGPNGRVAFVRSSPYRVDWVEADGRVTVGRPVQVEPIRVRRADQEAWINEPTLGGMQIGMSNNNGVVSTQMTRVGSTSGSRGAIRDYDWPDHLPIFRGNRSRVDLSGNVWVERYASAGDQESFDVFGPNGSLKYSVPKPEGRRIVGFGRDAIFMVYVDEFDLQYLERYRVETE